MSVDVVIRFACGVTVNQPIAKVFDITKVAIPIEEAFREFHRKEAVTCEVTRTACRSYTEGCGGKPDSAIHELHSSRLARTHSL